VTVQFVGRDLLPYSFGRHVSCLAVSGTKAVIGVVVDQSDGLPAPAVGRGVTVFATDTHGPITSTFFGGAPPHADRFGVDLTRSGCPVFPTPPASDDLYYVYNGDIVVHDAQLVPTSKEPVQERRLAELRDLQERGRLRQLRRDRRQEPTGSGDRLIGRVGLRHEGDACNRGEAAEQAATGRYGRGDVRDADDGVRCRTGGLVAPTEVRREAVRDEYPRALPAQGIGDSRRNETTPAVVRRVKPR
jgi:hypothetical protein